MIVNELYKNKALYVYNFPDSGSKLMYSLKCK